MFNQIEQLQRLQKLSKEVYTISCMLNSETEVIEKNCCENVMECEWKRNKSILKKDVSNFNTYTHLTQHILTAQNGTIKQLYYRLLLTFCKLCDDSEIRQQQYSFITYLTEKLEYKRIAADELEAMTALKEDELRSALFLLESKEVKEMLVIELRMLCYRYRERGKRQRDFVENICTLLRFPQEKANACKLVAKGIVEQNADLILMQNRYLDVTKAFVHYPLVLDGTLARNLEEAKQIQARKVIFYGVEFEDVECINLDEFQAEEIEFCKCRFIALQSMTGMEKKIVLTECSFWECICKETFLYLKNALISQCFFENLESVATYNRYLIYLWNSRMEHCKFYGVKMRNERCFGYGGFIFGKNSEIDDCAFDDFNTYEVVNQGYTQKVIELEGERISQCVFRNLSAPEGTKVVSLLAGAVEDDVHCMK